VHLCPANVAADDPRSYYEVAKRIHKETPDSVYINQYFNALNADAHYHSTGPEIWKQTDGRVTHVVVASGTGGTISGIGKYLKEQNKNVQMLAVDAFGSILKKYHETREIDENEIYPYRIEGLGKNLIPTATDFDVIDVYEKVTDKDAALKAREIVTKEGIFSGYTSGAVMQATEQYANKGFFNEESFVVLVFPDHGSRYMNKIYSNTWMEEQGFLKEELKGIVKQEV
jgi:cystathionine beta-synthase